MSTYLFDLDGTLIDSMPTYGAVMLRFLDERGIKYEDDIIKVITPLGYRGTAEYYKTLGVELSVEDIVEQLKADIQKEYENNIPAKPNVISVLRELKARGDTLNILTASPHEMLDSCLMRLGVFHLFDNVWSCDDFGLKKSDVEIYEQAAEKMGVGVESVTFLDDNLFSLKTARQAGMRVFGVYDASSEEYKEEIRAIAERYILDFSALL